MPAIFKALFAWSRSQHLSDDDVLDRLVKLKVKGVRDNFRRWQRLASDGVGSSTLPLSEFAKLLEAFGFNDLDTFIDLAWSFDPTAAGPLYISSQDREPKFYRQAHDNKPGSLREIVKTKTWDELLSTGKLNGHRFIIDRIKLPPRGATMGGRHYGFEAVYVERGTVRIEFPGENFHGYMMEENDFVSFNSQVFHQAINDDKKKTAVIFVARTLRSDAYKTATTMAVIDRSDKD